MASWEMQLISRIIRDDKVAEVIERGLTEHDFLTDEARAMFVHMKSYTMTHGTGGARAGINAVGQMYPNFVFCDDLSMTLDAYLREVRKTRLEVDAKAAAQRIINGADNDPIAAATDGMQLLKQLVSLGYGKQDDIDYSSALGRIIHRMELREAGIDMSKIHWPWAEVDEATGGIEPGDYIVYYGRPKSMKSWVLAHHASYTISQSKRPLIYTKEMHPDNIFMRMAACQARLPYQEFRMGRLNLEEKNRLYSLKRVLDELHRTENFICLSGKDAPGGQDSVEWLHAKIERYQPDAVFIDGLYLMSDGGTGKGQRDNIRVQNISRAVRQMVLETNIPVVATVQANRQAAKHNNAELDEIAFSDSIGQDVTVAIRVINEKNTPTIALVFGGSREFELHGVRIHGVPATNFSYFCDLTEKEILKAKEKDTSEEEGNNPSGQVERTPSNGAAKKPNNAAARTKKLVNQHLKRDVQ